MPDIEQPMRRLRNITRLDSGIAQFIHQRGMETLRAYCEDGYDAIQRLDASFSDWLAIPRSRKTTSIKPSGTVSLLAGATPGIHYPISAHYIRRVRLGTNSPLLPALRAAGYTIERAAESPSTLVVEFPVSVGDDIPSADSLSMWEQLSLAAFLQRHWADNQVSCTVTFDREREGPHIPAALNYFQYQLKGVSFLPRDSSAYPQMPYEAIDRATYDKRFSAIRKPDFDAVHHLLPFPERFCDSTTCEVEGNESPTLSDSSTKLV